MLKSMTFRSTLAALACAISLSAQAMADQPKQIDIRSGDLSKALLQVSKQYGVDLVYRPEQVYGLKTLGAHGELTAGQAVAKLLVGTKLEVHKDNLTGAMIIAGRGAVPAADSVPSSPSRSSPAIAPATGAKEGKGGSSGGFRVAQATAGQTSVNPSVSAGSIGTSSSPLEEVVVTAEKRSERLLDVPVPVTVVPAAALINTNQLRLADYYTMVPGLDVLATPAYGGSSIAIRGLSAGANSNSPASVGIVVDDVQYSGEGQGLPFLVPEIDPTDISQIEVLRGPQGTLYGASSLGGLLKYDTIQPTTDHFNAVVRGGLLGVQNAGDLGYSVSGAVNLPLSETWALRASGFTHFDPGYIDDLTHNRSGVNSGQTSGGRLASLFVPNDTVTLKLGALYQDAKTDGRSYVIIAPGFGDLQQDGLPNAGGSHKKIQIYTADFSLQLGAVNVKSISAYSKVDATYDADLNIGGTPIGAGSVTNRLYGVTGVFEVQSVFDSKFTQEVRADVPIGAKLDLLVGGYYASDHKSIPARATAENFLTGAPVGLYGDFPVKSYYEEYAGFTNLTVRLTDRFDIQLGGRESGYRSTYQSSSDGPAVRNVTTIGPTLGITDSAFTYLATPRFKVSPDLMLYARISSGYRSGGANTTFSPSLPPKYGPDKTENYEVGVKGQTMSGALAFDGSLYYIDWKNIQVTVRDPVTTFAYVANLGGAKSEGAEVSIQAHPITGLTLAAWVAYNDAELTKSFPATALGAYAVAGDRLPLAASWSSNISVEQAFPLSSTASGFVGGTFSYVGDRDGNFRTAATTARPKYPSYTRVDFRAGATYGTWEFHLFVNNLADKRGILEGDPSIIQAGGNVPIFTVIQPRTIGAVISKRF